MDEEFDELYEELRKMPKGAENSVKLMKKVTWLFTVSFEKSIDKLLHQKFWQAARKLFEEMSGADKIVTENVQNLIVGHLTALSLKVHSNYQIPDYGLPRSLTVSNLVVPKTKKQLEKKWKARIFCGFLMLRLGDLMRYKGYITKAKEFYEISLKINHTDRETWNQLGVVHFKSADFLSAIYFHTRSLHATVPFHAASANLDSIFKKFANRQLSATPENQQIAEIAAICLARIHFLLDIEDSENVLKLLGTKLAAEKSLIVSLMSVYEHLESGTELENRAIRHVEIIWTSAFRELMLHQKMTEDNVQLIALLLRAPEFCVVLEEDYLERFETFEPGKNIADTHRFDSFQCLKEGRLQYPITIEQVLTRIRGEESTVEEEETTYDEDEEEFTSEVASESSTEEEEEEEEEEAEDSDEEILRAGVRRQRVEQEDEDSEVDDIF